MTSLTRIAQAATVAGLTTTAQHLLLRDVESLKPEERYALGVIAIVGAFALWALQEGEADALAALLIIVAAAGLPPFIGYTLRRQGILDDFGPLLRGRRA